jgi:hypothetical protein
LLLLACWFLGSRVIEPRDAGENLIAAALGMAGLVFIVSVAVNFRINYWWSYLALLLATVLFCRPAPEKVTLSLRGLWGAGAGASNSDRTLIEMLGFVLIAHLMVVLKPEVSTDGLAMHLAIPAQIANSGLWDFNFMHVAWAVMPMGGDWVFTLAYILGGEAAARLMNFATLILAIALQYSLIRRFTTRRVSLISSLLFASTPIVQLVTGSLFVENVWSMFLLASLSAVISFRETKRTVFLFVAVVLLGSSCAAKFGALAFVFPILALLIFEAVRTRRSGVLKPAILALLVFAAPPYLTAYLKTGNPVYPFMNSVFRSPWFDTANSFAGSRFHQDMHADILWRITFKTSEYLESQNGAFGFHYFLLLPLTVFAFSRSWRYPPVTALFTGVCAFAITFRSQSNLRYIYPCAAVITIAAAAALEQLRQVFPSLYRATMICLIICAGLNVWFLPSSGWYHRDFANPLSSAAARQYLEESAPERLLVEELNRKFPGEAAAFFEAGGYAGLRATGYTNTWHHDRLFRKLNAAHSSLDCLRLMRQLGVRWYVAPLPESGTTIRQPPVQWFLDDFTRRETQIGRFYLARLLPQFEMESGLPDAVLRSNVTETVAAGQYDDFSRTVQFHGRWTRDVQFSRAFKSTLSYSDQPGESVQLHFRGNELTYVYTKAPNRGMAEIFIDGKSRGVLDLYSRDIGWQSASAFGGLGPDVHMLEIRVLGVRNPASSGHFVDVDAFAVK